MKTPVQFRHNGDNVAVFVDGGANLLTALREGVGDTSPKFGCGQGTCGVCTVLVDGEPQLSCLMLALECEGRSIQTIEGVARGPELHPLQAAFADFGGSQCGYCTPGLVMATEDLLRRSPSPGDIAARASVTASSTS